MISKREFSDVVNQVNGRFEWFTNKVNELEAEIKDLKAAKEVKPAVKKATTKKEAA